MKCLTAREIISEAFDRGVAEVPRAAEAREHCRACVECRRFVEGLALLRKTPSPVAPPALVDAIVERGRMMAEAGVPRSVPREVPPSEEPSAGEDDAAVVPLPVPRPAERDAWWWVPRIAVASAAVAAASFALVLSFQGFRALRPGGADLKATPTEMTAPGAPAADPGTDYSPNAAAPSQRALAEAVGPRYIALGDEAYSLLGMRTPDPGSITPVDARVNSSLDSSAPPEVHEAWRSNTDADIVFVRSSETSGTYLAFKRVVRTFGGKVYVLWGANVNAYGQWPALPSQYATPTASDGTPTFVSAGKDDSGLEIFAPPGISAEEGFAVAPGTTTGDPAAGDPNWTWWIPKR